MLLTCCPLLVYLVFHSDLEYSDTIELEINGLKSAGRSGLQILLWTNTFSGKKKLIDSLDKVLLESFRA